MEEKVAENNIIQCNDSKTKDWYAWINKMPPPPNDFHVAGEVLVPNPGVEPIIVPREPQGINPKVLLLDLFLHQKPGVWPQVMIWKPARYEKVGNISYTKVNIFCSNTMIAEIEVQELH